MNAIKPPYSKRELSLESMDRDTLNAELNALFAEVAHGPAGRPQQVVFGLHLRMQNKMPEVMSLLKQWAVGRRLEAHFATGAPRDFPLGLLRIVFGF